MKSLKISDGNSLFAKVHQLPAPLSPVHVVVPHTPEAEQMILMMNKNFPAYISFVLEDQGLSKDFISELIERSCCQTKAKEIQLCSWNQETLVLTTPRDKTATCDEEKMLQASWFKDAFAELSMVKKGKGKLPAPPPEMLYNLAEDRSIKTIHNRNEIPPQGGAESHPKRVNDTVILTESDEESASSSRNGAEPQPAETSPTGVDYDSPTSSSDEEDDDGSQEVAGSG